MNEIPDIKIYSDRNHWLKHKNLPQDIKERVNKKAQQAIYKELDRIPDGK